MQYQPFESPSIFFLMGRLTQGEGEFARDGASKSMYDRMFQWLIERLNKSLQQGMGCRRQQRLINSVSATIGSSSGRQTIMGLLDIYGFEVLQVNGYASNCSQDDNG
jgi:myosin-1